MDRDKKGARNKSRVRAKKQHERHRRLRLKQDTIKRREQAKASANKSVKLKPINPYKK
jgi:hypothetical protein